MVPRVLFVSKPVAPPFRDGTKCLVRDVALELRRYRPVVMGVRGIADLGRAPAADGPGIEIAPVYGGGGAYAPGLGANARAALFLLTRSRADLWHFVFAPNPRTSAVGRLSRALSRVPVVQTVASPPRAFTAPLFFGDAVVAQSRWTETKIREAFRAAGRAPPAIFVIPPPLAPWVKPTDAAVASARSELLLEPGARVFVYPGDLEVSRGAETVCRAVSAIVRRVPGAVVVFACRPKTKDAPRIERELRARLDPSRARFAGETDLRALLGLASAVLFPVDDLWGKVDVPLSLLEAIQGGVPVVTLSDGPLAELEGALRVPPADAEALADAAVRVATDDALRESVVAAQMAGLGRYDSRKVAAEYERVYDFVRG